MLLGLLPFFLHSDQEKGEQSSLGHCSARIGQTGPHKGCKALTHPGAAGLPCQLSPDNNISNTSPCLKGHPHKVSIDPVLQLRKQEMEACRGKVPDPRTQIPGLGRMEPSQLCKTLLLTPDSLLHWKEHVLGLSTLLFDKTAGCVFSYCFSTHPLSHPLPVRRTTPQAPWTSPWGFPGARPAMPTLHLGLLSISLSGLDHIQGRCKLSKEKQTYLGGVCEGTPQVTQEHGTVLLLSYW